MVVFGITPPAEPRPAPAFVAPYGQLAAVDAQMVALNLAPVSLEYVSASAIETFDHDGGGCPRKWAWAKLDRIPKGQNAGALLGSDVHAQHERWLRDGKPYDQTSRAGQLASATLPWLPAPGSVVVEQEIKFEYQGVTFGGKLDGHWFEPGEGTTPAHIAFGVVPRAVVLDHKTTGDLAWAKLSREDLLGHPQAPIYGTWATLAYGTEWAELRWNYVETKNKGARPRVEKSWHLVHRDELAARMVRPVQVAREIVHVVQLANESRARGVSFGALNLPYNARACSAFGGCPFRSKCNLSPHEEFKSMTAQQSDFLSRLNAIQHGAQAAQAPAPQPAAAAAPPAGAFVPGVQAPWTPQGQPAQPVPWTPPAAPQTAQSPAAALPGQAPWTPPGQPGAPTAQAAQPQGYGAQINPPESSAPAPAPAPAPATQAAPPPAPAEQPAGKGKGGKGKKAAAADGDAAPAASEPYASITLSHERPLYEAILIALAGNPAALQCQPAQLQNFARELAGGVVAPGAAGTPGGAS